VEEVLLHRVRHLARLARETERGVGEQLLGRALAPDGPGGELLVLVEVHRAAGAGAG
jgi:hypothetical protein